MDTDTDTDVVLDMDTTILKTPNMDAARYNIHKIHTHICLTQFSKLLKEFVFTLNAM